MNRFVDKDTTSLHRVILLEILLFNTVTHLLHDGLRCLYPFYAFNECRELSKKDNSFLVGVYISVVNANNGFNIF